MTLPFRRRTDTWSSPHERARVRAAERLDGELATEENAWLEHHLAECAICRATADGFEADRLELRALRRQSIEAPRDLWARTSAAIEQEAARSRQPAPVLRRARPSPLPLGALAGVLVVAVVFGATLLSGRPTPTVEPRPTPPRVALPPDPTFVATPRPTPLVVPRGDLDYLAVGATGAIIVYSTTFSEVCPDDAPECAPLDDATPRIIDIPGTPEHAVLSPDDGQVVVINEGRGTGTDTVWIVPVPSPGDRIAPTASPTLQPQPTEDATASPAVTDPPVTEPPTDPPATDPPASPEPSAMPPTTPIAVAHDVVVVGSAKFNPDGSRFAFSARPADGSQGPDIFVWTVGEPEATPITDDHRSVFSGWAGDLILASRAVPDDVESAEPSPDATPPATTDRAPTAMPETFVIDPVTGEEAVVSAGPMWRPAVDPNGTFAVYWEGTLQLDPAGVEWRPTEGRLVVAPWPGTPAIVGDGEDAEEDPTAEAVESPEPTPPLPTAAPTFDPVGVLFDGPVYDWEARWDEDGSHLGVWIADPEDPTIGRLSLYVVDPVSGQVDASDPELAPQWARPGFEIGSGHLAWATRDGQDGKGSHVKVVAWTDDGLGQVETKPGEDVLIVQR